MSSTRGLGFGCAIALAAEGVRVVINGRSPDHGILAASKLGKNALFVKADISQPEERARLFREAKAHLGEISILITNADGPQPGTFMSRTKDWMMAFETIMLSALDMAQRCLPGMIERGYGRIVNISSTSAEEITPGAVLANGIRKTRVGGSIWNTCTRIAAGGVTVNSILPGPFDTDRIRQYVLKSTET